MSDLTSKNKAYSILISFISPILGLFFGLKTLDRKGKHLILTLFGLLYGLTLNFNSGSDGETHSNGLISYYGLGFEDFLNQLYAIIIFKPLPQFSSDVYLHILSSICGSIFESPKLLFTIVGFFYGYLYGFALLNVIRVTKKHKIGIIAVFLIILFVTHRSYENMQTIRSWTGMWILFNGVFGYHSTKQKKYLFLIFSTPLFHFMYLLIVIPAVVTIFIKYIPKNLIILIFVTSFASNFNTVAVVQNTSQNEFSSNKIKSYSRVTDDETIDPVLEKLNSSDSVWYLKYGKADAVYYGALFFMIYLLIGGYYNQLTMTKVEYAILSTALLMASLANFGNFVYTFYSRTMANAAVYILAVMVLLALRNGLKINKKMNVHKFFIIIGILIFVPKMVYFISNILIMTSSNIILFPFLELFDDTQNISIRELIDLLI